MDHRGVDFEVFVLDRRGQRPMDGTSIRLPSLVIHESCGLSAICLKSWIGLLVVVLINNKCRFHHGVHPLRYWHILPPIKSIFPITIPNEVPLFLTSLAIHVIIIKNINGILSWSHVSCFIWRWRRGGHWGVVCGFDLCLFGLRRRLPKHDIHIVDCVKRGSKEDHGGWWEEEYGMGFDHKDENENVALSDVESSWLVSAGPVRSGFWTVTCCNRNCNRLGPQAHHWSTGPNCMQPVQSVRS